LPPRLAAGYTASGNFGETMKLGITFVLVAGALAAGGCSDDTGCTEGEAAQGGLRCCAGGCGMSTNGWSARICRDGEWVCEGSNPALEDACASPLYACTPLGGCSIVGIGKDEPDPAPELCCEGSCNGTTAVHRVCKTGTLWECPAGTIPVSACKDYKSACGGILAKYKDNSFKLP